jgi:methionyl-tRNA formyltransferase
MRIVVFANNRLGWKVTEWLREQKEEIAGIVLHPAHKRKYGREIIAASGVPNGRVFDGSQLGNQSVRGAIGALNAHIGISVLFGLMLRREVLNLFRGGCINLHPSLLPYNRGAYPNVWSIVDQTPAGATLHYIDEGLDTGDIIAQQQVCADGSDTGQTLYERTEIAAEELFRKSWPLIRSGAAPRIPQASAGTFHRVRDTDLIDEIDLERSYKARDLINILRARSFPPYSGAYFRDGDRKVFVNISLTTEPPKE